MDKVKKVNYKKQLIRNPAKDNPKGIVIRNTRPIIPLLDVGDVEFNETPRSSQFPQSIKKTSFSVPDVEKSLNSLTLSTRSKHSLETDDNASSKVRESKKCTFSNTSSKLDVPGVLSSLTIGKKIDRLGKMRTTSSMKSISEKRSFDDKITTHLNFPYEKKIFRDLMPLSSPNKHSHTVITSREPILPKDREPMLEDFMETKEVPEYSYIPNVKLEPRRSRAHCNNLRLYKVLQFLEQC